MLLALLLVIAIQEAVTEAPGRLEARGWNDFPVLVWRQRNRGRELSGEFLAPFDGINVERDDEAQWARARGVSFYVGHGPGRDDLHLDVDERWQAQYQSWYDTRDEALLVRTPCLTDPATIRRMEETLDRTLAARGGDHGLGISLGDEVGLTPYGNPFDLCRSKTCTVLWHAYAEEHGWPADSPTTDEVRIALGEDDFTLLGPWLARRRFQQEVVLDTLRALAKRVRTRAPGTPVGLLGLSGQTAFGGVSVPRVSEFLDFLEVYPVSESPELLQTDATTRSLGTVFLNEDTPDGTAWQAWRHWMRGGDGLVVWSDKELEDSPEHRRRLTDTVNAIRALEERFPEAAKPRPELFAIVHDADSIAASWLKDALLDGVTWPRRLAGYQEENGTREAHVRAWLRLIEDAGFAPGAIALEDLGPETTARFPVLILPRVLVLGGRDLEQLEAHLERGGTLVIDGEFAWVDRRGEPFAGDALQTFEGHADRVVTSLSRWLESEARSRYEAKFEPDMQPLLSALDAHLTFADKGGMDLPCVRSRRRLPDGRILVAMLPNTQTPEERELHLRKTQTAVVPDEGYELQWLHPMDAVKNAVNKDGPWLVDLPAGDAAVFLLTPKR